MEQIDADLPKSEHLLFKIVENRPISDLRLDPGLKSLAPGRSPRISGNFVTENVIDSCFHFWDAPMAPVVFFP